MEIDSIAASMSGKDALQKVFDELNRRKQTAESSFENAIACVVLTAIFCAMLWLLGTATSQPMGWYLLALAMGYCLIRYEVRAAARNLESKLIGDVANCGFEVEVESGNVARFSVSARSEGAIRDWLRNTIYPEHREILKPFAWSPGPLVAGIQLKQKPTAVLSRATYRAALARRINRLVREAGSTEARRLVRQIERWESAVNTADLSQLGDALVEASEWLNEKIAFPLEGVPAVELEHDEELQGYLHHDDSLEAFLNMVYHERDDAFC